MDILVGLQWGDEGKGKFIDRICRHYDVVARYNGGANAGHSIYYQGRKVTLKLLPSGIFYPHVKNVIGTGVVVDPSQLRKEIQQLKGVNPLLTPERGLMISNKAHLVLPTHKYFDIYFEESTKFRHIGTTKNGIAQAYASKILRQNLRVGDIYNRDFHEEVSKILDRQYQELLALEQPMPHFDQLLQAFLQDIEYLKSISTIDTELFINQSMKADKKILAEGAQAVMLDIDHGTYPYVTSSNTIASGACTGLGVSPRAVQEIYGVTKAYCTRVGNGVFPTEIFGSIADDLREKGNEFGSNTKRPRRIGWLDLPALKYAVMLNGITQLILTKADILNGLESVPICTHYEINGERTDIFSMMSTETKITPVWEQLIGWDVDFSNIENEDQLPTELKKFIHFLAYHLEIPVKFLSTGPNREEILEIGSCETS